MNDIQKLLQEYRQYARPQEEEVVSEIPQLSPRPLEATPEDVEYISNFEGSKSQLHDDLTGKQLGEDDIYNQNYVGNPTLGGGKKLTAEELMSGKIDLGGKSKSIFDPINQSERNAIVKQGIDTIAAPIVEANAPTELMSPEQIKANLSRSYNLGNKAFSGTYGDYMELAKKYPDRASEFMAKAIPFNDEVKSAGQVLPGLVERRAQEQADMGKVSSLADMNKIDRNTITTTEQAGREFGQPIASEDAGKLTQLAMKSPGAPEMGRSPASIQTPLLGQTQPQTMEEFLFQDFDKLKQNSTKNSIGLQNKQPVAFGNDSSLKQFSAKDENALEAKRSPASIETPTEEQTEPQSMREFLLQEYDKLVKQQAPAIDQSALDKAQTFDALNSIASSIVRYGRNPDVKIPEGSNYYTQELGKQRAAQEAGSDQMRNRSNLLTAFSNMEGKRLNKGMGKIVKSGDKTYVYKPNGEVEELLVNTDKQDREQQKLKTPYGLANSEDDAKKLKEAHEAKSNFDSKIDEMIQLRKEYGGEALNREAVARGKQLSKDLLLEYKNMAKLGVLSKTDEKIINAIIPDDPLAFSAAGIVGQDPILTTLEKFRSDSERDFQTRVNTRTQKGIADYEAGRAASQDKPSKSQEKVQEVERKDKSGKIAIFDAKTQKFLRYK